ncbi:FecR domain-containing protein [Sphingomonas montanisoli]|uniref:Peptidoglycan-binding protein n=1 Tax=Sphingomonas montanisoli TaxID=2606412 RepID=A0A5D9C1M4_9SPHN|nr:FecR domain-containing protein [Sphingomonas montanisoli]TZG25202.1 peptidoglycan-binding protein [Sphingomonas montanisoli]
MKPMRAWKTLLLTSALLLGATRVSAAEEPLPYTMKQGDILLTLARDYMTREADYLVVQRLNGIADPRRIPVGTVLMIPPAILRTEPVTGEIASFRGTVTVNGKDAAVGTKVGEGMRVETGPSAFVSIRLPDASAISLPSQSRILVTRLRRIALTGAIDDDFKLEAGRARMSVTPFRDPGSKFRVTTPLSVTAVRGTDFRVAFEGEGKAMTEVVGGKVAVAPDVEKPTTAVGRGFGVIASPDGVGDPIALLPAPQLANIEKTATGATISAKPLDGARKYRIALAADARFTEVLDEQLSDTPSASFALAPTATFFIRLTAIDSNGLEGLPGTFALSGAVPATR